MEPVGDYKIDPPPVPEVDWEWEFERIESECPWCKTGKYLSLEELGHPYSVFYVVLCNNCHAQGPHGNDAEQAVNEWNRLGEK